MPSAPEIQAQPSLAPATSDAVPARRTLHALLGVVAFAVLVVLLWAPLLPFVPAAWMEQVGGVSSFRWMGFFVLAFVLVARFLIRPPKPPSRKAISWGKLAASTGGTLTQELRRIGPLGWSGGVTVRWDVRGTEMRLQSSTDTDRNETTQLLADVSLARGFQFHLVQENLLTKIFMSEQLWSIAVVAVRAEAKNADVRKPGGPSSSDVADRLAFLASKEIVIGDPKFDDAFLLKSDTPAEARSFFADASVAHALHELDGRCKGWQLSLMSKDGASAYQLTLAIPGPMLDPPGLDANRKLFLASIRCLGDRGLLASMKSRAA
jgi:hypothetical protein